VLEQRSESSSAPLLFLTAARRRGAPKL